jgi:hypothetical protein
MDKALRVIIIACALFGAHASASGTQPAASEASCRMSASDRSWVEGVLLAWPLFLRKYLHAPIRPLPPLIVYDARCSYRRESASDRRGAWAAQVHGGRILLPNGNVQPPTQIAFHVQYSRGGPFTAMSLPSLWSPDFSGRDIPLAHFLEAVLLHELTHSYQGVAMPETTLMSVPGRASLDLSTGSMEAAFAGNSAYVRDRKTETGLLLAAATAPTDAEATLQACRAYDQLRGLRQRYFRGRNAYWARVDDIFLISEGLGQWAFYIWLTGERGIAPGVAFASVISATVTHNRAFLLFLTVDRLVPDWRSVLMSSRPPTAEQLLGMSCSGDVTAGGGVDRRRD